PGAEYPWRRVSPASPARSPKAFRQFRGFSRPMPDAEHRSTEVDLLLENARLRDALEPFYDDSLTVLDVRRLPTQEENEFLESMLAWEQAPVLPISRWFEPELVLPAPESLTDKQLHK